jgi:hypothetical protein
VSRLKPGATTAEANAQLDVMEQPLFAAMKFPKDANAHAHLIPLQAGLTAGFRNSLLLMWGAVFVVLLIG